VTAIELTAFTCGVIVGRLLARLHSMLEPLWRNA
jgi:hypothetical protein